MKKALDFQHWEVQQARGGATGMAAALLGILPLLGSLVVLAVGAIIGEEAFSRGFWFLLFLILPFMIAAALKLLAELVQIRYRWETGQVESEDD